MHRTISYISKRLVQIRAGEGRKVILTFLYFFLVITAYYVIKPVSRSLVLGELGSRMVPYVDLVAAVLMGPIVTLFARLVDRIPKPRLVSLSLIAVSGVLVVFWRLLAWPLPWIAGAFYVWVAIFSVLVVTLFWLVANDLYHPREAKRLFGFIGSGGILGGVVGSSIAAAGAQLIGTEGLLLLSSAVLLACWVVVRQLWRFAPQRLAAQDVSTGRMRRETFLSNLGGFLRLLRQSRYFLLLIALVAINKVVATLIYYQLNPFIEQTFPDRDAKTTFTSLFLGSINVAAFVVQFLFTSWILRRWGVLWALLVLPVGVLAGTSGLLLFPLFWIAATTELYDASLNYSLQQTTKEILYLPIDRTIRYKLKPFIDMVVFRFGKGIAAIIGIILLDQLGMSARWLSCLSIPLVAAWIFAVVILRHDYVTAIRRMLQVRAASRGSHDMGRAPISELGGFDKYPQTIALEGITHRKLALATQLFTVNGAIAEGTEELLKVLTQYEQRTSSTASPEDEPSFERLKECLGDRHELMVNRRYAIRRFVQQDGQEAVDCLLGMLMVEEDSSMRQEFIRGLVKLRMRHPHLEFPKRLIRRQIAKEVQAYQRISQIALVYHGMFMVFSGGLRKTGENAPFETDPVLGLLRVLMDEATQQIFRCLSLVYRPEDIYLVYNQLREPDMYVRADAVELLDNLIDPGFRWLIFPVLDEDSFLQRINGELDEPRPSPEEAARILRQGIWDHNRWLGVVVICLVGRLRLEPIFAELDQAAQSKDPLLSMAAKVAQRLATMPTPARAPQGRLSPEGR